MAVTLTPSQQGAIKILQQAQAEMVVRGRTINVLERWDGTVCAFGALQHTRSEPTPMGSRNTAARALNLIALEVYGEDKQYDYVNDFIHVEYAPTADGGRIRVVTDESTEEVLEDFDIAIAYIRTGKVESW